MSNDQKLLQKWSLGVRRHGSEKLEMLGIP